MTPLVIRYPLDPTGRSPNNFVQGEQHTLVNRQNRAIATQYGAFFTESLRITDMATNQVLTPGVQYFPAELYELPTARYGKEICAIIVITDVTVSNQISIDYQCLGGEYGTSATAIIQQIDALNLDSRPVSWGAIIGKPSDFPPSLHLHDAGDIYGFEYVVHALDRIRAAIELGDAASHDAIYAYIDHVNSVLSALLQTQTNQLTAHLLDHSNPHQTTAAQVGAYTTGQVDAITTPISQTLTNHVANTNNPHNVTAAQLKVYLKTEVDTLLSNLAATVYTKTQVDSITNNLQTTLMTNLNNHTTNKNNPHQVTAAQLGVYTTTQSDAITNPISTLLNSHVADQTNPHHTTAAQVGAYTTAQVDGMIASLNGGLSTHTSNYANPHQVSKAQVGLGNVPNLPLANASDVYWGSGANGLVVPQNLSDFRNGWQTISWGGPGSAAGYRDGHIWYQLS